ncbi:AI-2E family transporter [Bacillus sp. FJAT-44742]|uniref:AI-2E family transporter n=1 Tax=Bacillus sp. FJAT-44742 TaxID=2014005 RepID=UPI000C2427A6|nr:AI-2E family transporter [Bacillus sp. FJAT-44742]
MPKGKFFTIGYGIIVVFIIIYLGTLIDFIFTPIVVLIQTLFAPIILAGVLYYLGRPVVKVLSRRMPRVAAILLLYLGGAGLISFLIYLIGPELQRQFYSFVNNVPFFINEIRYMIIELQNNEWINNFIEQNEELSIEELTRQAAEYLNDFAGQLGSNLASLFGAIANFLIIIVIIPFILFYMLKEGEKAPNMVLKLLPLKHQQEGRKVLSDMDNALSSYIQGQIIVSFCVGVLVYIGYLIIGLDYSLVLALVAMFTNVIPFIGPWIGTFPGVIVGLLHSPLMALLVIIIVVVVQQIESNVIAPQVMGRKLSIHPLTIILLLLVAGRFAGLIGLLLAVPTYAVGKVIVSHTYRLLKLRKPPEEDGKL